jgi:NitT/TauT family transport system substrate-binding protein
MLRRNLIAAAASSFATPAIVPRAALGQTLRKVKMGTALSATTVAAFGMPALLKPEGVDLELVTFPSVAQRMQAVASGEVDIGNGGLSAAMQFAAKGSSIQVLANGCDGGWLVLAQPSINSWKDLAGRKIAVQSSSIGLVSLNWKLRQEGLFGKVELAFMGSQDQPASLMRGDVAAICPFEPFAALAEQNGWGKRLWVPYESPMGKTNLGLVASTGFVKANSDLARKMVAAHVKATQAITADPTVVVDSTVKTFNVTREVAERSTRNLFFTTDSGAPFVSGLKALSKMMIDDKLLEKEPDWVSFLNLGYV